MSHEIVENFFNIGAGGANMVQPEPIPEDLKIFIVPNFFAAVDRLLLKRLPPPKEGLIVRPQIAEEQSEYGYVIAIGRDVEVPVGAVAKFSKHSGPEEIHFEDEQEGDEYILVYKQDIRGWFLEPESLSLEGVDAGD